MDERKKIIWALNSPVITPEIRLPKSLLRDLKIQVVTNDGDPVDLTGGKIAIQNIYEAVGNERSVRITGFNDAYITMVLSGDTDSVSEKFSLEGNSFYGFDSRWLQWRHKTLVRAVMELTSDTFTLTFYEEAPTGYGS